MCVAVMENSVSNITNSNVAKMYNKTNGGSVSRSSVCGVSF